MKTEQRIVIVGGGFAGLAAVRALSSAPVKITLIDRGNHHLFQPLLYQVATAGLSAPDIAAPLRHILRKQKNVEVLMATVVDIKRSISAIILDDGTVLNFDCLLLASGATHSYFGNDQWAPFAPGLKTLDDALDLRKKLLYAFERAEAATDPDEREAWLSFGIVGGGPTGVELAGTLAEVARHTLKGEFRNIDPASARVCLIEAGQRVLGTFPEHLSEKAKHHLEDLGVEVLLGAPVNDITAEGYSLGGKFTPAKTVVWAAGVAASPLGALLHTPLDRAGRVLVEPDLSVPGSHNIFVAGDLAARMQENGKPVPGVAPAAKQMGQLVADNMMAYLNDKTTKPFAYQDFGNLATIGRMAAVVDLGKVQFSGMLAWWFWLITNVFFLIGFRNRLIVLLNWFWAYWSFERGARIILGRRPPK